jgi:hypothetical protein
VSPNGTGSDWAIAIGGRLLVGKLIPYPMTEGGAHVAMSPCYELIIQPTPQGVSRMVVPLLFFSSSRTVDVTGLPLVHFDTLNKEERRQMMRSIEHCEEMIGKMRAAESGLIVADKMPQPPR